MPIGAYKKMKRYAEILKAVGEPTRLRIVRILLKAKVPLCVCEIMDALRENQTNISKHLKILRYTGIVNECKKGRWMMYSLNRSEENFLKLLFKTIEAIPSDIFREDDKNLKKRLGLRKNGMCVIGMRKKGR
jgi:ArsR family transcriptional regulator